MIKLQDIFPENTKPLDRGLIVLLALVAVTLPFKFLVNAFIVIALLFWIGAGGYKKLFIKKVRPAALIAILSFYVLHLLSFLYTSNIQETFISLETKISLLIFPLIFYTGDYNWPQMKLFLKAFILGNIALCLACLVRAVFLYFYEHENHFYYEGLSWFQHPSYLSMYLTFCCVTLVQKKIFEHKINILLISFFTLFVLMLSSKTGIAIHFLFLIISGVLFFSSKGNYMRMILFLTASVLVLSLTILFTPPLKERFTNALNAFKTDSIDKSATESTAVRVLIWGEAKKIIANNPVIGVSPGDANEALYTSYKENGLTGAYDKKLNAHSQYFQTGVGLGFVGLLSLLAMFLLPFFQNPRKLLLLFILITAINFLTESMLQTMAGAIFFGYFYALLCFDKEINPKIV